MGFMDKYEKFSKDSIYDTFIVFSFLHINKWDEFIVVEIPINESLSFIRIFPPTHLGLHFYSLHHLCSYDDRKLEMIS